MSIQITLTGIVLSAMPIGEYDKRLVILTKERGKITAFARGARKQNNALMAPSQPFSFGEFVVYEGRSAYTAVSANISNYFMDVKNNLEAAYLGMYFCEFADYMTRENSDESEILKLLFQSLRALGKGSISLKLIRYIYEFKLIAICGESPRIFECIKCKDNEQLVKFSVKDRGIYCDKCNTDSKCILILGSTLYTMQYIISSAIEKLYTFTVSEQVFRELKLCVNKYRIEIIDRDLKSLSIVESLIG